MIRDPATARELFLDAVEAVWWERGDAGLSVRSVMALTTMANQARLYALFGDQDGMHAAAMGRAGDGLANVAARMTAVAPRDGRVVWEEYAAGWPARFVMVEQGWGIRGAGHPGIDAAWVAVVRAYGDGERAAAANGVIRARLVGRLP